MINQATGNQTLIEFNEIKIKVKDKMKEYNLYDKAEVFEEVKGSDEECKYSSTAGRNSINPSTNSRHKRLGSFSGESSSLSQTASKVRNILNTNKIQEKISQSSVFESTQNSTAYQDPQTTDLQILQDSFDSLFTSSILFDQQSLAELISSLGQLTVGVLENLNGKKKYYS